MKESFIPAHEARAEIEIDRSRFIASISPATSVAEARQFIHKIKTEFSDASHNVPAFQIGHGHSITAHAHDDGEPSGTAGRPILAVIQGAELGDTVIVVTRYFGGIKLGKGGLVRAYTEAAQTVIGHTLLATKQLVQTITVILPYNYFESAKLIVEKHRGFEIEEQFAAEVTVTAQFLLSESMPYTRAIIELTNGRSLPQEIGDPQIKIVPV